MFNSKTVIIAVLILAGFGGVYIWNRDTSNTKAPISGEIREPEILRDGETPKMTVVAEKLEIPWAMVFLPDGSLLFTERPGRVRMIDKAWNLLAGNVAEITNVKPIGEGGLLGIALHPDFSSNNWVYLYYTYEGDNDQTLNCVSRSRFNNNRLVDEEILVDVIPGAPNHNGGRIKFGPDGYLYITTGDAGNPSTAQNTGSLSGKILRVTDTGKPASGNPFGNLVYSYGHRNPQGLAWDSQGRLWATEHGRSGTLSGLDELNLIVSGRNYGWPVIQGDETGNGMEVPRLHSAAKTWAPAGAVFVGESLFFGGLRGEALYEADMRENKLTLKEHFTKEFGRIRDVVLGPDGFLYFSTSNRDGRGDMNEGDDKIIKLVSGLTVKS